MFAKYFDYAMEKYYSVLCISECFALKENRSDFQLSLCRQRLFIYIANGAWSQTPTYYSIYRSKSYWYLNIILHISDIKVVWFIIFLPFQHKNGLYLQLFVGGLIIYIICLFIRIVVSNTYCVFVLFAFVLCKPMLPVFLDCSFLIVISVFSNVYILHLDTSILKVLK